MNEAQSLPGERCEVLSRPSVLQGKTYRIKRPSSEHAVYVTINDVTEREKRRPHEIFINCKAGSEVQFITALTRMISTVFRAGGDVSFVGQELQCISDPDGGWWDKGHYHNGLVSAIGATILRHIKAIETGEGKVAGEPITPLPEKVVSLRLECPSCGQKSAIRAEGCITCQSCGYNRCG